MRKINSSFVKFVLEIVKNLVKVFTSCFKLNQQNFKFLINHERSCIFRRKKNYFLQDNVLLRYYLIFKTFITSFVFKMSFEIETATVNKIRKYLIRSIKYESIKLKKNILLISIWIRFVRMKNSKIKFPILNYKRRELNPFYVIYFPN